MSKRKISRQQKWADEQFKEGNCRSHGKPRIRNKKGKLRWGCAKCIKDANRRYETWKKSPEYLERVAARKRERDELLRDAMLWRQQQKKGMK